MDRFKKYIQNHKEELDTEIPDNRLWDRIAQEAFPEKKAVVRTFLWRWMAAAACVLILIGCLYFLNYNSNTHNHLMDKNIVSAHPKMDSAIEPQQIVSRKDSMDSNQKLIKTIPNPLRKTEQKLLVRNKNIPHKQEVDISPTQQDVTIKNVALPQFTQLVSYQRQYINTMPIYGEPASYFNDFKTQLRQMDDDEHDVRKDIKKNGLNINQLDLLINIYQQKIDLLKQLSKEINRINKSYYQNHFGTDSIQKAKPHFLNI